MTWLVVKFDEEETVEAVPHTWYIEKTCQCYWPPQGTVKLIDFIKKKHIPTTNWMLYKASTFWALMTLIKKRIKKQIKQKIQTILLLTMKN